MDLLSPKQDENNKAVLRKNYSIPGRYFWMVSLRNSVSKLVKSLGTSVYGAIIRTDTPQAWVVSNGQRQGKFDVHAGC